MRRWVAKLHAQDIRARIFPDPLEGFARLHVNASADRGGPHWRYDDAQQAVQLQHHLQDPSWQALLAPTCGRARAQAAAPRRIHLQHGHHRAISHLHLRAGQCRGQADRN